MSDKPRSESDELHDVPVVEPLTDEDRLFGWVIVCPEGVPSRTAAPFRRGLDADTVRRIRRSLASLAAMNPAVSTPFHFTQEERKALTSPFKSFTTTWTDDLIATMNAAAHGTPTIRALVKANAEPEPEPEPDSEPEQDEDDADLKAWQARMNKKLDDLGELKTGI